MSERRDEIRRRKRLPIRFWKRGEDKPRSGFTTNISSGGMFIGANHVMGRGTRLRIEVMDPTNGFVVEGIVARAERSHPELRSVQASGMGIRFLPMEELVRELFPPAERVNLTPPPDDGPDPEGTAQEPSRPPPQVPAAGVPAGASAVGAPAQVSQPATEEAPPPSTRAARQLRGFAVRYPTLADLRRTYERDIQKGGLFISTQEPAERGDTVVIEIRPPESVGPPFRLRARVVHTFERSTQSGLSEANLLAGMGVEWLDPEAARKSFEYYLGESEAGPA